MKKRSKKIMASLLSGAMIASAVAMPMSAFAADADQLDVAAISDIQYQAEAVDADGLILSKSEQMLNEAIAKINATNPDVVLVTGDLTNDGSIDSHMYVAGRLAEMADEDTKVYVTPGEKDLAKSGVNPDAIDDGLFSVYYSAFGYGDALEADGLSYVASPKAGYKVMMLDSVGENGEGKINKDWAVQQLQANTAKDFFIGGTHFPSMSRGSVESTLIGLLYTVAGLQDANGNQMYTDDPFVGLNLVDKSAFATGDMEALSNAGLNNLYTGHSYQVNTYGGASVTETTNPDGTITTAVNSEWNDFNVGSLVAASASVTNTTFDRTITADPVTTIDKIETLDGANVRDLVFAAQQAYTPAMVDSMIAKFMPVYDRLMDMLRVIGPKVIDNMDFGAGLSGDITAAVAKPAVKQLLTDVLNVLDNRAKIEPVIAEIKAGLLSTEVASSLTAEGVPADKHLMSYVFSDIAVQLQADRSVVAPSISALVDGMKADPANIAIPSAAVKSFAGTIGQKTLDLINEVLDQKLTLRVIVSEGHTIRELLHGQVSYFLGLVKVDLWAILDNIQPLMPDGTPVPPEDKPSAIAKPLTDAILMKADGSKQDLAGLKAGIIAKSDDLVNLTLRFGLQDII